MVDTKENIEPTQWEAIQEQVNQCGTITISEIKRRIQELHDSRIWLRENGVMIEGVGENDNGFTANFV